MTHSGECLGPTTIRHLSRRRADRIPWAQELTTLRYLAVGDIHGCFKALATLAAFVPFQSEDTVITLGDYVNRGPDSCAVLDWLIAYQKQGNLVALRGNHEIMMLRAREGGDAFERWLEYGG